MSVNKPLKILVYSSVFYPAVGGIENLSLFLVKEFVDKGHVVKVITEQKQNPSTPLEGIEIVHASQILKQLKLFFWCDIIYMPNITLKGIWLFLFNPFKKWAISHNDFSLMYTKNSKAFLKRFFIKKANLNIAVSHALANYMHVPCLVIHNCYNNDLFKLYDDEIRDKDIVFIGRLVSQKGCEMLIDACANLQFDFTLSIVGDGDEYLYLNQKVKTLNLENKIKFLGVKQNEDLARFINQHKVMVVPSMDVEGFGIVALEGLACGCTMLVSKAGGLSEAVVGHSYSFEMKDTEALEALLNLTLKAKKFITYNQATADYLKAHSKSNVADSYLKAFHHLVNKN